MNKWLNFVIKISVTIGVVSLLYWIIRDELSQLVSILCKINVVYVAAGFSIFLVSVLLAAQRLGLVFLTQGLRLKAKELLGLTFMGFFLNSFLPTGVGGDVIKAYYVAKKFSQKKIEIYASVFADRVSGLTAMISISFIAMFIINGDVVTQKIKFIIVILFLLTLLLVIFVLNKKFAQKFRLLLTFSKKFKIAHFIKRAYTALNNFKNHKGISLLIMLTSFISQIILAAACFILSKGLNIHLGLSMFIIFVPITSIVSMIPSLGGIGPREGAFIMLFSPFIGLADAAAIAILWLAYYWLVNFIGGIIYMFGSFRYIEIKKDYDQSTIA